MYSCSKPNIGSNSAKFSAAASHAALVFVVCGVMSTFNTSHITKMLSPPLIGSWNVETGLRTQSELSPVACSVLEPSKPHIGGSVPFSIIFVLLLNLLVGVFPSIHIYSAFIFIFTNVVFNLNIWKSQNIKLLFREYDEWIYKFR